MINLHHKEVKVLLSRQDTSGSWHCQISKNTNLFSFDLYQPDEHLWTATLLWGKYKFRKNPITVYKKEEGRTNLSSTV